MRRVFRIFSSKVTAASSAAVILSAGTLVSQLLGLFRDRLLATTLGAGPTLDTYYAAFRLPDMVSAAVGSLASLSVLMPVLSHALESGNQTEARRKIGRIISGLGVLLVIVCGFLVILLPLLAPIIVPGFSAAQQAEYVRVARILFLSPVLLGISFALSAVTQYVGGFFASALGPILYNLGIIIGIVSLYPRWGIVGLAAGVVLGAVLHGLVQVPVIVRSRIMPIPATRGAFGALRGIAKTSIARTAALAAGSVTTVVATSVLSLVGAGAISLLQFGLTIQAVPVALAGMSISVASFPILVRAVSQGRMDDLRNHVSRAGTQMAIWSAFLCVMVFLLRHEAASLLVGVRGNITAFAGLPTVVSMLGWAIVPLGLVHLSTRVWYALGETRRPLFINGAMELVKVAIIVIALVVTPVSARWVLVFVIALSLTAGSWINVFMHQRKLHKKHQVSLVPGNVVAPIIASVIGMGIVTLIVKSIFFSPVLPAPFLMLCVRGGVLTLIGFASYLGFLSAFPKTRFIVLGLKSRLKI